MKLCYSALKTPNAGPDFGRKAYLLAEDLGEAALAPASGLSHFTDGGDAGSRFELAEGVVDDCVLWAVAWMRALVKAGGEGAEEIVFKAAEPFGGRGDFAQTVSEDENGAAPEILQCDEAIAEDVDGVGGKGSESGWLEDDADQVGHVGGIDNFVDGAGADDEGWRRKAWRGAFLAVEQEVAGEIEDYLDTAAGQHALKPVFRLNQIARMQRLSGVAGVC